MGNHILTILSNFKLNRFFQLIQSFLNIRKPNMSALEDGEVWAMIYYSLRCGQVRAAVDVARKNSQLIGDFLPSLIEWTESPDRMLGPNQESKLKIQVGGHTGYKTITRTLI